MDKIVPNHYTDPDYDELLRLRHENTARAHH